MKFLRTLIDKTKPNFEHGAKWGKLNSTYEAFESFLFVDKKVTSGGVHIKDSIELKRTMFMVVLALVPATLFGMYNAGVQHFNATGIDSTLLENFWFGFLKVMPIIIVSYVVGLGIEFAFAQMRRHEVNEGFLVSGLLIPLIMPIDAPLWMVALSTAFAVVIGKEVFGGTGMNVFNPALIARAFMFFSYAPFISGEKVWVSGVKAGEGIIDGFSGATPLTQAADAVANKTDIIFTSTPMDWLIGTIPGSIGETSFIAIMIGAAFLLLTGIANWRVMLSVFAGGYVMGLIFNLVGSNAYMDMPAHYHLLLGGFAFGAVFMATDPVTGSQTNTGKYIYGTLIGMLAIVVRVINPGYPEGMMMSILFMNAMVPLIDHYVVEANIRRRNKRITKA